MRQAILTAFLATIFNCGLTRIAPADEPTSVTPKTLPLRALTCPETLLRGCCDTYCPKPLPCVKCFYRDCGPDDYCEKPCPGALCFRGCCTADRYCCKPCPDLCRPLAADYFSCVQRSAACAESQACASNPSQFVAPSQVFNRRIERTEITPVSATPNQPQ